MEASHAVEVLEAAIQRHGKPEIANSDQGSQFTGESWILALEAHKVKISHDGVAVSIIFVWKDCGGRSSTNTFIIATKPCGSYRKA